MTSRRRWCWMPSGPAGLANNPVAGLQQPAPDYCHHWHRINHWLARNECFWRPVPFAEPAPAWRRNYPELAGLLEALSDTDCEHRAENLEDFTREISLLVPGLAHYRELISVPLLVARESARAAALAETRAVDMPGRKRLQAGAFAACLRPLAGPLLDWCCGKGYLARTLARQGAQAVLGFERNPGLVEEGNRLARHYGDAVTLCRQDVMAPGLGWPASVHGVALHACGDLHRQLIRQGSSGGAPRLSLSPCCYHLTDNESYTLMSARARQVADALVLAPSDLRLAVQETVTAPARVRAQARRISQWRLGFDALQRHIRKEDVYLPVPSHPPRLNSGNFAGFCTWAAGKKNLSLPAKVDWSYWQHQGERRLKQVRRHELLRHVFRRPLELWLVLDYAVFLEEQGYRVRLGTFCDRSLTPRNLLLDAVRSPPGPE